MKHPARYYIYYLLSRQTFSLEQVVAELEHTGLLSVPPVCVGRSAQEVIQEAEREGITFDYVTFLRGLIASKRRMRTPTPFRPRTDAASLAFLKEWRIADAWGDNTYYQHAYELLLTGGPVRYTLELMLLGPLSHHAIADRLQKRYGLPTHVNAAVVRLYGHYFWDTTSMSPTEWREHLKLHHGSSYEEMHAALSAPRSAAGAALTIALADKDPSVLDAVVRYETVVSTSFTRFMHHMIVAEPSSKNTMAGLRALQMMVVAEEQLDARRGGSAELLKQFERLTPIYDQTKPKSLRDAPFQRALPIDTTGETTETTHEASRATDNPAGDVPHRPAPPPPEYPDLSDT